MRCLYCGKELALLKRLTRSGEFCSESHKQSYQEEYNRLGLSRLLQARSGGGEGKGDQKTSAVKAPPVAVEEPAAEEVVVQKVARPAAPPQVIAAPPVVAAPPVIAAPPEPPPPAAAGFLIELPPIVIGAEPAPYLEPTPVEDVPLPTPALRLEGPAIEHAVFTLPSAELLPLEVQPGVCENGHPSLDTDVAPKEFGLPRVNLSMPLTATWSHNFQPGGSVAIEIAPRPSESSCYASLNGALDFSYPAAAQSFDLMELSPSGIAYPAEDCDVTFPESWTNGIISEVNGIISEAPVEIIVPAIPQDKVPAEPPAQPPAEPPAQPPAKPETVTTQEATPRAALEALSKLHQNMRKREEAKPAASRATPPAKPASAPVAAAPKSIAEPAESVPREASDLLAISLKSFAPPKASPVIDAQALLTNDHPLLPRLKALPLRPKVAPAPRGFGQQPKTAPPAKNPPPETKTKPEQSVTTPPAQAAPKPGTSNKPAQPAESPKPAKTSDTLKPGPPPQAPPLQSKKQSQPAEAVKVKPPAPSVPAAETTPAAQTTPAIAPTVPPKPVPVKSAPAAPKAPVAQPQKPVSAATASSAVKTEAAPKTPAAKTDPPAKAAAAASSAASLTDHTVPNFGAVVNTSMFGSLKVKAGIAALAAVLALGGYFVFFGKSKTSASPIKASDGVGPSIMVGEGGWVEGWAGDAAGLHAGRQITIYRPSLKLSDYRIEFLGQIETKSIGWVFRAANPDNYYAMKLELVSPELPLTVVLYKYMVLKGRQVQVGRVPIDVPVKNDTVFSVRVDVRGPKFSTYVQGQPVDVWTDDQLKSGGVGFLNERDERGKIKSVSMSYLSGGTK